MAFLWIIGVLCALVVLIALLRVGVRVTLHGGEMAVDVKVGPVRFRVFPGKDRKQPSEAQNTAQNKKTFKEAGIKPASAKSKLPKIPMAEIKNLIKTLWPPLKEALARTRRGIRIDPLQLSLTVGGEEDPAEAAQLYGKLSGAVWTSMPVLERMIAIREPQIHLEIDFQAPKTTAEGTIGISIRMGTALAIMWTLTVPGVKWFLAFQKRQQKQSSPTPAADAVN